MGSLKKNKYKLSKQLEQEENHRNGDHMEGYQRGEGGAVSYTHLRAHETL